MSGVLSRDTLALRFLAVLALLSVSPVLAGGGRHNVLVVVNDNSPVSQAIGEYYRAARDIPTANVCHINCTASESISGADYTSTILGPIESHLTSHGLADQIQYVVLTKGIPLRVSTTGNSVDSTLSLAFQREGDGITPCIDGANSPYSAQDSSFGQFRSSGANSIPWSGSLPLKDLGPRGDGMVFAVGGHFIARSANGYDWEQLHEVGQPGVMTALNRVSFSSGTSGWAVGENDSILKTTDGGATWRRLRGGSSSPQNVLSGVCFTSPAEGWIVGRDQSGRPLVLRTRDGGISWAAQSITASSGLNDVLFTDSRHGWIVGDSDMLRTTDGGATWTQARNGTPAGPLTRIFFADANNGWVIGRDTLLCRTTDGGATWAQQPIPGMHEQAFLDCHFIDRNTGWIVTSCGYDNEQRTTRSGRLLRTTDGGVTWTTLQTGDFDFPAVYFANAQTGWYVRQAAGQTTSDSYVFMTTNGGSNRTRVYTSPPWNVKLMYLVCRLDAYGADARDGGNGVPDDIEDMISGSISPDTTGCFVMDASTGNIAEGNAALADAAGSLISRGRNVLLDQSWTFVTGAYPGIGPVAGYASWGSNDSASRWNSEWAKPNFTWKPGSIAMCYVSTDGRSFAEPPDYLRCGSNAILDEGLTYSDPGVIRIYNGVCAGWVARLHDDAGDVVSSAPFSNGSIYLPCAGATTGYIQVYRSDGVTPLCGARYPASGTAVLAGGRAYRLGIGQSLIADYISEGCSAAVGSVSEPMFGHTFPQYTFPRYADGYTWAESAWMGIGAVPWTFIAVGDPLMAPYATPPSVAITSPSSDGQVMRGTVEVQVTGTDAQGVARVELWVDDKLHSAVDGPGPDFRLPLDTGSLSDGPHTMEAIACEAGEVAAQGYASRSFVSANADSVADLFRVPDGMSVCLRGATVSRTFPSQGIIYIQEGRVAGIRVATGTMPMEGDVVTVTGTFHNSGAEERYVEADALTIDISPGTPPRPVGMKNEFVGGASRGGAPGITEPSEPDDLYNIGMLIETWGRITCIGTGYFYIDDGSVSPGIRVDCTGFDPPTSLDAYVKAIGISSMQDGYRVLLVDKPDDIRLLAPTNP